MNPTLAAPQDLGRSNTGYKSDEYVTLVLHSSVVEEIIPSLVFNNKVLWQRQTKVTTTVTVFFVIQENWQTKKAIRKYHLSAQCVSPHEVVVTNNAPVKNNDCLHPFSQILEQRGKQTDVVMESKSTITKLNNSHSRSLHTRPSLVP